MKKIIITFGILLVVLVAILFISEKVFKKQIIEEPAPQTTEQEALPILDIKEQYKNSTYTFVGSIDVPTPCHTLDAKANLISDGLFEITINTIAPKEGVVCAQVITPKQYSVSFKGPEEIMIYANIDNVVYELNRFVVPEGENINTFQLQIKG